MADKAKGFVLITKCSDQERLSRVWELLELCGFTDGKYSEAVIGEKDGDWRITLCMLNATLPAKNIGFRFVWLLPMKHTTDFVVDLSGTDVELAERFRLAAAENIFDAK